MRFVITIVAVAALLPQSTADWTLQSSGVTARLRGVSAASDRVVWASGANGTVLRTEDGGASWRALTVPDASTLDFRDVDAVDERTAYILSIGPGEASRIYKTTDAGSTWTLQLKNTDPKMFFDAMAFRDPRTGYAFSDSVDGQFVIFNTTDGGKTWSRVPTASLPQAQPNEGAYAASGTNVAVDRGNVWIGTTLSRVLRWSDAGGSWRVTATPLPTGPSAGIFSIAFRNASNGIVVGGDYKKEAEAVDNAAVTYDGGATWRLTKGLSGFRSAVAYVPTQPTTIVATGPAGTDISRDDGKTWKPIPGSGFHAMSFAPATATAWGVGENGKIGRLTLAKP
jgi:photosystem II stability/assembly factor-like uncharacterized protein